MKAAILTLMTKVEVLKLGINEELPPEAKVAHRSHFTKTISIKNSNLTFINVLLSLI